CGGDVLAVGGVVTADRAGQRPSWMLDQRALPLVRADVGAVMDDPLLLPAEEPEVAVLVGAREVARVEPAIDHDLPGRVRRLPVAEHAAGGADPDPTHLPSADRLAVFASQCDGAAADRHADRPLPDLAPRRAEGHQARL